MSSCNAHTIEHLRTLSEEERDSLIEENTDTSQPIHCSIIPAALAFGTWPSAKVFWHYLPEILVAYPEFFHWCGAGWVEYCIEGPEADKILTPFYSVIRALGFASPSLHGPAFLYAAKVLGKDSDTVEWLELHGKELYRRHDIGAIGYLTYSYSQSVQIALIKAARLAGYSSAMLEDMIEAQFVTDRDGNNNVFSVLPLTDGEKSHLRHILPGIHGYSRSLIEDFL